LLSSRIITMLPSSPQVKSVYNGSIIPTLQKLHGESPQESFCIDSTTLDVDVAREVALNVANTGATMIDAPVSGGAFLYSRTTMCECLAEVISLQTRSCWRDSWHIVILGWWHGGILHACATHLVSYGSTYYTLWAIWLRFSREDMQ